MPFWVKPKILKMSHLVGFSTFGSQFVRNFSGCINANDLVCKMELNPSIQCLNVSGSSKAYRTKDMALYF